MYLLDDPWRKNMLLDILAYFLWDKKTAKFFSSFHSDFGKKLYQEILKEMKKDFSIMNERKKELGRTLDDLDIEDVNLQCKRKSELYFLEERLALIEERLSTKG
ncbi:MAG: hypothetical protein ACOX1J_06135 [Dethiobacteria bacterium]|jgi:uncharacterized ferritin-like protein (DUF455 family)